MVVPRAFQISLGMEGRGSGSHRAPQTTDSLVQPCLGHSKVPRLHMYTVEKAALVCIPAASAFLARQHSPLHGAREAYSFGTGLPTARNIFFGRQLIRTRLVAPQSSSHSQFPTCHPGKGMDLRHHRQFRLIFSGFLCFKLGSHPESLVSGG